MVCAACNILALPSWLSHDVTGRRGIVMRIIAIIAAAVCLSGCAQRPDEIKPTFTTDLPYRNLNCQQLRVEYDKINLDLFRAGRVQHTRAEKDMFAVLVVGIPPVSGLSGTDQAVAMSGMIGQLDAIVGVAKFKQCPPMPQKASELHFQDIPPEQDRP